MASTLWHDGATVWRDSRLGEDGLRLTVMVLRLSEDGLRVSLTDGYWFCVSLRMVSRLTENGLRLTENGLRLTENGLRHTVMDFRLTVMTLGWSVSLGWYLRPSSGQMHHPTREDVSMG